MIFFSAQDYHEHPLQSTVQPLEGAYIMLWPLMSGICFFIYFFIVLLFQQKRQNLSNVPHSVPKYHQLSYSYLFLTM